MEEYQCHVCHRMFNVPEFGPRPIMVVISTLDEDMAISNKVNDIDGYIMCPSCSLDFRNLLMDFRESRRMA